ncbi:MAG: YegP family protein [Magnetococcus sp. YQC-3]
MSTITGMGINSRGVFELFEGRDKQFYFHLKAPNGEIIAQSEGYKTKQGANDGIEKVKKYAPSASVVEK